MNADDWDTQKRRLIRMSNDIRLLIVDEVGNIMPPLWAGNLCSILDHLKSFVSNNTALALALALDILLCNAGLLVVLDRKSNQAGVVTLV